MYRRWGKRLFDILLGLLLAGGTLPLQIVLGLVLWVYWRGNPFFFQNRPGRDERMVRMVKFRTMRQGSAQDAERLTPLGRWLRLVSLDELPQLWLVVVGKLSLVGPRPLLEEYLPLYSSRQRKRHTVRPGITGWAQVSGRNDLDWPQRLELDVRYTEQLSLPLDLWILWQTLESVVRGTGVRAVGHETVPKFVGERLPDEPV